MAGVYNAHTRALFQIVRIQSLDAALRCVSFAQVARGGRSKIFWETDKMYTEDDNPFIPIIHLL